MKFGLVTLLATLLTVESSRYGMHHGVRQRRALHTMRGTATASMGRRRRRKLFNSGGGLMKMDYIMDFRPAEPAPPTPPTPRPTPSPTKEPVDTPSPTKSPVEPPPVDTPPPTANPEETDEPTASPVQPPPEPTPSPTASPVAVTTSPTAPPVATPAPTVSPVTGTEEPTSVPVGPCEVLDFIFVEEPDDVELDVLGDGYSGGDSFLFEDNDVFVENQQVGSHTGKCTVLQDLENEDAIYCITEFEFGDGDGGKVMVQGLFEELIAIGGTGCYAGVTGKFNPEDDPLDLGGYGYSFDILGDEGCSDDGLLEGPFVEPYDTSTEEYIDWDDESVFDAGDILVFDNNPFTSASGAEGTVEGECLMLYEPETETTNTDAPFCTITFKTEDGDFLMVQGPYDNMVIVAGLGCFYGLTGSLVGSEGETGFEYELNLDDGEPASCTGGLFDAEWTEPYGDFYVDYVDQDDDEDFEDAGEGYVFEDKPVAITSTGGTATLAGKCLLLAEADNTYCNIVYTTDEGSIAVQGWFDEMIIVGGTGCFQGLAGSVAAEEGDDGFIYTWDISS